MFVFYSFYFAWQSKKKKYIHSGPYYGIAFSSHTHFSSFNVFILPENTDEQSESGDRVVAVFSGNPLSHLGKTRSMATPTSSSDEFCLAWALNGAQTIRVAFIVWDVVVASFFVLCRIRHARFSNGKTISNVEQKRPLALCVRCLWLNFLSNIFQKVEI